MRHQFKRHRIARGHAHRKATLAALTTALIKHKRIRTTISKAKALRVYAEPILNRAKQDSTHNRREVFRHLQDKYAVTELFTEIAGRITDRNGGYTRVVKLGARPGDAAEMAVIELVDFGDQGQGGGAARRTRRTRRGGGRTGAGAPGGKEVSAQNAVGVPGAINTKHQDVQSNAGTEVYPVAEDQTTPVMERTEPNAEAKAIAAERAADADAPAQDEPAQPATGEQAEGGEPTDEEKQA